MYIHSGTIPTPSLLHHLLSPNPHSLTLSSPISSSLHILIPPSPHPLIPSPLHILIPPHPPFSIPSPLHPLTLPHPHPTPPSPHPSTPSSLHTLTSPSVHSNCPRKSSSASDALSLSKSYTENLDNRTAYQITYTRSLMAAVLVPLARPSPTKREESGEVTSFHWNSR